MNIQPEQKSISILGTGWLGLPLAEHFVREGYSIKGSTRSKTRFNELESVDVKPYAIDLSEPSDDLSEFLQSQILIINITSKDIEGFKKLLEVIKTSPIKKVLFISSTSVYPMTNSIIKESDALETQNHPLYLIEELFRNNNNFVSTIIRFGGLIGYNRHPGRFFSGGKTVNNPNAPVNLIHRDDCIGLISAIIRLEKWGETFNACADTHPTKREFYTYATESIGSPPPHFEESEGTSFKIIRNIKLKSQLEYKFKHPDLMKIKL